MRLRTTFIATEGVQEVDSGDLSEELVCGIKEFDSAVDINHVLRQLYKLLAANKISPRRGSVIGGRTIEIFDT